MSSIGDGASDATGILGLNSVGEDKMTMFKTCSDLLPSYPRWHGLPSGTCRSADLSMAPSRGEELDARDIIRLYKDTMRKDAMKFGDPLASVHARTQQELKITESVAAYNAGDIDKVTRIEEH